ncbi:hypothetical protein TCAL_00125 [Tigriopus californicus]|uniref:Forkhead box protein O n=1 Tax=Tigriopus californicus TaxID=6832 RepID=A0A553PHT8_TIGCA|nr:hypothetical protein TCAL_00125 [Tigriopus californicus]
MEGPETMAALEDFDCALLNVEVKGELGLETGLNLPNNLFDDGLPEEITKEIFALENEDREIPFRSRCNTWPRLQNPINLFNAQQSVNDNPDSVDSGVSTESTRLQVTKYEDDKAYSPSSLPGGGGNPLPLVNEEDPENDSDLASRGVDSASTPPPHAMRPKMSSRRNPWGNMSYADLITQAIQSSPNQRLTLAQIYEWLVKNVTYFQNKGDNVSSLGWKNSIRHNLSLHNKFMRVQNEGAGKSSWWMLNPEESKPVALTKPTRRRANTLDSTTKFSARRGQRAGKRRDSFSGRTPNKDLKKISSEQLRTTGIVRQPSPQLPPQLCLPQDHVQGQSMGLVDDKAFQELREIQMEQQELVDQTTSTTLAFSQALPHKIKILEQRDLPSNRPLIQGSQDIAKPWDHALRTDGLDHQSLLGRSLPNPQSVFEANRFRPTSPDLPPAFIRSTSAETLVSSPQGANFPPVTNNSFLNTALASQPLSTLSESMDESPYYEEFMKTEVSSSDLTDFDFGLVSALDSALASETSSSQPNSFHQIML